MHTCVTSKMLIAWLWQGRDAMRIAVITPYFKEPIEKLRRCHDSVLQQTHADIEHIMVADGFPKAEIDAWPRCLHIHLPVNHNDSGDTPRIVGSASACARRFDGVVFLDADNWFDPGHIGKLVEAHQRSGAPVVTCARRLVRPDTGEVLGTCTESDGQRFNDTNCYLITEQAYPLLAAWGFRNQAVAASLRTVGDRLFWSAVVNSGVGRVHVGEPTVNYETTYAVHYPARKLEVPEFAKMIVWLEGEQGYRLVSYAAYRELLAQGKIKRPNRP